MNKLFFIAVLLLFSPVFLRAQFVITGKITDLNRQPLAGATVSINTSSTQTNALGYYSLSNIKAGNYILRVSFVGYGSGEKQIRLSQNEIIDITLKLANLVTDEVIVKSTRAQKNSPTTFRNVSSAELEKNNLGQDLPYLLNQTPSVVVSSDAGNGVGYTGIRIRGSDATRINVTLNGIPLNDAESQGSFFVNLPDFASSVDNIQIQRGVGTSTNGAGAFGASLNIQTTTRRDSAYAELNNTFGSYDTRKHTVNLGTGLINNQFSFDGRLSQIKSDGYIDRASSNLKSYFITGAFYGRSDLVRANVFSGTEKTYQAWNGVAEELLKTDRRHNDFTYDNQTDNYQQDHYQLFYTHTFSDQFTANTALHYTYGRGYYEEYKTNENLADYKITPVTVGDSVTAGSDLVRRLWLDNDFYGATYSFNYTPSTAFNFSLGGAYNEYKGRHFDEVIWARFANYDASSSLRHRYNENDAFKSDFNIYGKANYTIKKLSLYADLQYRKVHYSFLGFNRQKQNVQQQADLNFFNPKAGLTYLINEKSNAYASIAVGNKEPNRNDYIESTPDSRPKPENLKDIEAGYRFTSNKLFVGINGYAMLYKNQLVLTGELNDVGAQTRSNVADSYRAGVELEARREITNKLSWAGTATYSRNKIRRFTEFIYDETGNATKFEYKNTDISFSPNLIASSEIEYSFLKNAGIALLSKYVSKQYLDNRSDNDHVISSFFVNDVRVRYSTSIKGIKSIGLNLIVNNVFSTLYENNGYTYGYIDRGQVQRFDGYYPQATRNFLAALSLKF